MTRFLLPLSFGSLLPAALLAALGLVGSPVVGAPAEPSGPSSRRTALVITEIMYHPAARTDGKNLEYVELYNSDTIPADISGFRLSGDADYAFPAHTLIPARSYLVVAAVPTDVQSGYGLSAVLGGFGNRTNSLPNDRGTIRLRNKAGAVLLEIDYSDEPPWPAAADGAGHSLALVRPSLGERDPRAWAASAFIGGSPGRQEPADIDPLHNVVINEFLAHTDDPEVDYIELYNHSDVSADISGCILTDDPTTNKFTVPVGTTIPPRGFLSFTQTNLLFALSAAGETIYLKNPTQTRVLDAVRFGGQENGVSTGRFPDGADQFYRLISKTPGAANTRIRASSVVLNEIMYHPISEEDDDEYIELHNRGPDGMNLGGWRLSDGIRFTIPPNTFIGPGSYLVVARDATRLITNHSVLTTNNTVGNFDGSLSDRGERIALEMPDQIVVTNQFNQIETNTIYISVDEVTYGTGGRWGKWADGGGSSLELIDPAANHRLASNWGDSDETGKAPWTNLEVTGVLDNGATQINNLQVILLDAGECLLDDVEVIGPGGTNRIANADFERGIQGWVGQGTHEQISLEPSGYGGSTASLHLRATADGDTGANRVRTPLSASLSASQTATIRAKVRWLRGRPEIILRVRGNYLELAGRMALPSNLGTPGETNSRALANAAPAIYLVSHSPALPAANQPVVVTARVEDSDPLAGVLLKYRKDPSNELSIVTMTDDGTGGDTLAGDGVYAATIPGQTNGTLIAFQVQAVDNGSPAATATFPAEAPKSECLVRFGESVPPGAFGTYRIWTTQATFNKWRTRLRLSNDPLDATFVYGNSRVVYNIGVLYSGSPFHSPGYNSPTGNPCDYKLVFPKDDFWLDADEVLLSWPGNSGDDSTGQREQAAYWIADQMGLPFNYRRFVNCYLNGVRRSYIMEDTQRASPDVVQQWYPNDRDGELFKVAGWFEFDDAASTFNTVWATLQGFTTPDLTTGQRVKKPARYRWNWQKRNPRNGTNDFNTLFALVEAVNTTGPAYVSQVERQIEVEQWLRTFAVEHIVGNWDSYGNNNGQNMYAYKPPNGPWKLLMWDLDIALGGIADGPTSSLFQVADMLIGRLYSTPAFRRIYWRAMLDAVNGPLNSTNVNAMLDAKYAAFQANGISASSPGPIKNYITSRRNYLNSQLATVAANFAITSNGGADFSTNINLATLTGSAPINVATIKVNGIAYQPAWPAVTSWTLNVPLRDGLNALTVEGFDRNGNLLPNATAQIRVTFTGSADFPFDHLVINEIMYHPALPNAGFVEIYNRSSRTAFDLSGYRLDGADFIFPAGSVIGPNGFLVVANDLDAFASTYGRFIPVAGVFQGRLNNAGETLRLILPGATPLEDIIIDEVTYSDTAPWPPVADGFGPSLQLIDAAQDNRRSANWTAVDPTLTPGLAPYTPGAPNSVASALPPFPFLWLNEVQPNNESGVADRFGEHDPWVELFNAGPDSLDLTGYYLTESYSNLLHWAFPAGQTIQAGEFLTVWLDGEAGESQPGELHANFRITPESGSIALVQMINGRPGVIDHLDYFGAEPDRSWGLFPDGDPNQRRAFYFPTPGGTNDPSPGPFTLFINEWMASNTNSLTDPADGKFEDWLELYNPNSSAVNLAGFTLTDNPTNTLRWTIPPGATIEPHGYLLVWADNDLDQNNPTDLHAPFKLDKDGEQIALFAPDGQLVDAVVFGEQVDNVSQGRWPDGDSAAFFSMPTPTPRASNTIPTPPPLDLQIVQATVSQDGYFALSWTGQPGRIYRVQYKDSVEAPTWTDLSGDIFAYDRVASKADPAGLVAAPRFYRVLAIRQDSPVQRRLSP